MGPLVVLAAQVGAGMVKDALTKKIGAANADLATDVLKTVAAHAGVAPEDLDAMAVSDPEKVKAAIAEAEKAMPEMIALYGAEVTARTDIIAGEADEPTWARVWRPLGMYVLMFLWLWNAIILHVANAIWKIALPPMDWATVLQLSALYMSLYMGGHTIKAVFAGIGARA